jgi:signal transduction histidine kinase
LSETTIARFKTRVLICVALLLLGVAGFSSWSLYSEYRHIIGDAERTSSGYAKALSDHAESALAESDRALRDIVHDINQKGGLKAYDQMGLFGLLSRQAEGSPQIGMVFLVNRAGTLYLSSSNFPPKPIQVADREYFKLYLAYPDTELYLSNPLISRTVGRWRFNIIRPIRDPKGNVENLAAVAFNADYFENFFTPVSLGKHGRIMLIRSDGIPLVNEPATDNSYNADFSDSELFQKHLPASPSGTFHLDQASRNLGSSIVSYQKLSRFPVVAVVTFNRDDLLMPWYRKIVPLLVMITLLGLAAVLLARLLFRHLDHLHASRITVAEQKTKLETRLKILEEMATACDLDEVLQHIVSMVEQECTGAICSVLLVDEGGHNLRHRLAPGLPDAYNSAVDGLRIAPGMGSCGTAAYTSQRVVVEDIATHPYWKGFTAAAEAGLRACWSEPIFSPGKKLLGTFAIYYKEVRSPQPEEIELIESAAHLAGIAIGRVHDEKLRSDLELQLLHVQKIEAIGQLAGGVAHDFNNLLTPIIVYADMLNHRLAHDTQNRTKSEGILAAAHKAKDLTQKLLSFGRKQMLSIETHDLNRIVESFQDIMRRTIRENITVTTRLAQGRALIAADRGQIEQILLNLAVNAQDAIAGAGQISIETGHVLLDSEFVRLHPGVRPGSYIMMAFHDNGCGMPETVLGHIFEPFFTTKPVGHGTGLGLATVYGIIKQHNGYITVSSKVGEGSTFLIYLPEERVNLTEQAQSDNVSSETPGTACSEDTVVLLVEDNEMVREMGQDLLQSYGYRVLVAALPSQALELASAAGHIDLLVSDVVMPEMNGQELFERLSVQQPGLPVLFISGHTRDVVIQHGTSEAGPDFLQKPFTAEQFIRQVKSALQKRP